MEEPEVLGEQYLLGKCLGSGAYGVVRVATCLSTDERRATKGKKTFLRKGDKVAIKKIAEPFSSLDNARRLVREIRLLRHFRGHPNVVRIWDVVDLESWEPDDIRDVFIVTELMESDLARVLKSDNVLTHDHIAYIAYQILCGVQLLHSAKVVHRDLKPSNILLSSKCQAKLADFGLARSIMDDEEGKCSDLTEYVMTRWWRAPEVLMGHKYYKESVDLWSVGCIIAEMYNRKVLFQGENFMNQMELIFEALGVPDPEASYIPKLFRDHIQEYPDKFKREGLSWDAIVPTASDEAKDLLSKLLVVDPSSRISVEKALRHPFFAKFYNEEYVTKNCVITKELEADFEKLTRTRESVADLLFREVVSFRPEAFNRFRTEHKLKCTRIRVDPPKDKDPKKPSMLSRRRSAPWYL